MTTQAAFDAYKAAAADYRTPVENACPSDRRNAYAVVERTRQALCIALGYERVHDHLGEFCNIHERDIPGHKYVSRTADGLVSYNGFCVAVSQEQNVGMLAICEMRAVELETWFHTAPVDRFVAGASVVFERDGLHLVARYDGEIIITSIRDFFDRVLISRIETSEVAARDWFTALENPVFVKMYGESQT